MKAMKKKLAYRFLAMIFIALLLVMLFYFFIMVNLISLQQKRIVSYGQNMVESIAFTISTPLQNMRNAAKTFINDKLAQQMAVGEREVNSASLVSPITMARSFNPELIDIMLTDINGNTYSLIGYLSSAVENHVKEQSKKFFKNELKNSYLMFMDKNKKVYYILHFMPIYATRTTKHYGEKVGTLTIMCRADNLIAAINTAGDMIVDIIDTTTNDVFYSNRVLWAEQPGTLPGQKFDKAYEKAVNGTNLIVSGIPIEIESDVETKIITNFIISSIFLTVFLFIYIIIVVQVLFIRPIRKMNSEIAALSEKSSIQHLTHIPADEIGSIAVHINELLDTIEELNRNVIESKERIYQTEIMKKKAQLYAYQNQINPHFLYNMLQCIRGIALANDMNNIADICTCMADIFRYSIKGENLVSLENELSIINKYLFMLKVRFQDNITYQINASDNVKQCIIPKLILQPIVENAVFHGLAPLGYKGKVWIDAKRVDNTLFIRICNNGVSISPEKLAEIQRDLAKPVEKEPDADEYVHIGIINVHNKIRLLVGMQYGLDVQSTEEETVVTIRLPIIYEPEATATLPL